MSDFCKGFTKKPTWNDLLFTILSKAIKGDEATIKAWIALEDSNSLDRKDLLLPSRIVKAGLCIFRGTASRLKGKDSAGFPDFKDFKEDRIDDLFLHCTQKEFSKRLVKACHKEAKLSADDSESYID